MKNFAMKTILKHKIAPTVIVGIFMLSMFVAMVSIIIAVS